MNHDGISASGLDAKPKPNRANVDVTNAVGDLALDATNNEVQWK